MALMVKNTSADAGDSRDPGLIPRSGRSPKVGNGTPLQSSCLENSMGRGAWQAMVHGAARSPTWLSNWAHVTCHVTVATPSFRLLRPRCSESSYSCLTSSVHSGSDLFSLPPLLSPRTKPLSFPVLFSLSFLTRLSFCLWILLSVYAWSGQRCPFFISKAGHVILSSRHSPSHSEVKSCSPSGPYPLPYPTAPSHTCLPPSPSIASPSTVTPSLPHHGDFSGHMAPLLIVLLLLTPRQPHQPLGWASNTLGMLQN